MVKDRYRIFRSPVYFAKFSVKTVELEGMVSQKPIISGIHLPFINPLFSDSYYLSMESIRLGGPAHAIVTKTVHKTLPGGGGGPGGGWVFG